MSATRREFLWTVGSATGAALAIQQTPEVFWAPAAEPDLGWTPGIEDTRTSVCLLCPARCGIRGRLVDGRLVGIAGNRLHPMSRGGLCPRGIAGVQVLYHPERIAAPLSRAGPRGEGQWQPLTRDGALTLVSERLAASRDAGRAETVAVLAGYCAGTMRDLWHQFLSALGSTNYIADEYADGTEQIAALMHGIARRPAYDMEQADLVVSFGAPLFESWWSPLQAFVAYGQPERANVSGTRFIQVDTRFSKTAARAHGWIGIRPETYAVLALGVAYVLIRDQLYDAGFVDEHVRGFDDFRDAAGRLHEGYRTRVMRTYRTEEVSARTGVSVERVAGLARALAESRRPLVVCGDDVLRSPNGLLAGLAVHSLNVLLGRINRPGGILFGNDPPLAPLGPQRLTPTVGTAPPFGTGDPALAFAQAVGDGGSPVDALFLYYANPLASSSDPDRWRRALEHIPLLVSFSPFMDETTRYADVVIPDLLPYERWQDGPAPTSYPYPAWGVVQPMVTSPPAATHTGDAILAMAQRLGGATAAGLAYDDFEALLRARARGLFAAQRGMIFAEPFAQEHHRQMEERGWWLPEHAEFEAFWDDLVQRGGWSDVLYDFTDRGGVARTPSGRIELLPESLIRALEAEEAPRSAYLDVGAPDAAPDRAFPLRLLPYRVSTLASGTLHLQRWIAEQPDVLHHVYWSPWVGVHPETAHALGLEEGALVWVISAQGRYRARVNHFPGTAADQVCAPYGLRHPDGELANPLRLLDRSQDRLTGLSCWYSTFVRLERA